MRLLIHESILSVLIEVGCSVIVTTVLALLKTTDVTLNNWLPAFCCDILSSLPLSLLFFPPVWSLHLKHFIHKCSYSLIHLAAVCSYCSSVRVTVILKLVCATRTAECLWCWAARTGNSAQWNTYVTQKFPQKLLWLLSSAVIGRSPKAQRWKKNTVLQSSLVLHKPRLGSSSLISFSYSTSCLRVC